MRSSRVERWLEGKETPLLLQGLTMGETLGVGSFGEVRVGTLPSGEHCAVKLMDPRKLSGTSLSEMVNEVNALAKLRHVHVIRYYGMVADGSCTSRWCNDEYCGCLDFEADDDGCCSKCGHSEKCHATHPEKRSAVAIVQELAAGGDLVSLLFTSSLGYRMDDIIPRTYFHQLLDGIEYCHSQRICHGDIKPENLCLNSSAMLKIVDFGLCHELGSSTRGGGGSGRGSGGGSGWSSCGSGGGGSHVHSGCYTAPEIHAKNVEFDRQAADVWSCGVVLYMMIAREVPFEYSDGIGPAAMRDGTFPWPATMDGELRSLIRYMLDPNPASRWTIEQVKQHAWYRRPIMPQSDLSLRMADHMQNSWVEQKKHELVKLLQSPQHSHTSSGAATAAQGGELANPPAASAAISGFDGQPFSLSSAGESPAPAPGMSAPSQTIRHLSFGVAAVPAAGGGVGRGGGGGATEARAAGGGGGGGGGGAAAAARAGAGGIGDHPGGMGSDGDRVSYHANQNPRSRQEEQPSTTTGATELRLASQPVPDFSADDAAGDGGGDRDEAEPEAEADADTQAQVQAIPAMGTATMQASIHTGIAAVVGATDFDMTGSQRHAQSHGHSHPFSAPTLPVSVPSVATTGVSRPGTPELSEYHSASAPTLGMAAATLLDGDAPPPVLLPRQDSHTGFRDRRRGHLNAAGDFAYWDLDESSDSESDENVDFQALPMEGAGEGADGEGEPESDAMDTSTVPMQTLPAAAHDPPPVAAGLESGFFGKDIGAATAATRSGSTTAAPDQVQVLVPPRAYLAATASSSSTVTNRNSKRTHSKTKETKRDSTAAQGDDDAAITGRRPKTKRTLSQTRIADDAMLSRAQAARSSDGKERGHQRGSSQGRSLLSSAVIDNCDQADVDATSDIDSRKGIGTPEPDQDADRYKSRKRASWRGSKDGPIRMVSTAPAAAELSPGTALAEMSGHATLDPTQRARGPDSPAGVAVHTYISLPGDVTKNQAVEMLTSSLKHLVIDASISRTNSGDVIIRHSAALSTISTDMITDTSASNGSRESTGTGTTFGTPSFRGSSLPSTPESVTNGGGSDSTFQVYSDEQQQEQESHDVAMGTAAAMNGMTVSGRQASQVSPSATAWTAGSSSSGAAVNVPASERAPEREALMKAQVYERPPEAGGGAVIAVQRLRGAVLPHLQQFARIKEHVERAATRSGLTPPGAKPVDTELPRAVPRASVSESGGERGTPTPISAGKMGGDSSDIGTIGDKVDSASASVTGMSKQAARAGQNADNGDDVGLESATAVGTPEQRDPPDRDPADAQTDDDPVSRPDGFMTEQPEDGSAEAAAGEGFDDDRSTSIAGSGSTGLSTSAGAPASRNTSGKHEEHADVESENESVVKDLPAGSPLSRASGRRAVESGDDASSPQQQRPKGMKLLRLSESVENESDDPTDGAVAVPTDDDAENVEGIGSDHDGFASHFDLSTMAVSRDSFRAGRPEAGSQSTHDVVPSLQSSKSSRSSSVGRSGNDDLRKNTAVPVRAPAVVASAAKGRLEHHVTESAPPAQGSPEEAVLVGAEMVEAKEELDQDHGQDQSADEEEAEAQQTGGGDDGSSAHGSTLCSSGLTQEKNGVDSHDGERRRRVRRRSSGKHTDATHDRVDLDAVAVAAADAGDSDRFAALGLDRQDSDRDSDAGRGINRGNSSSSSSSEVSTDPQSRLSGSSAARNDDVAVVTGSAARVASSGTGTRRLAGTNHEQVAPINVVGEKRTPADVGLWDRRHQRASSEEPEEIEFPSSHYSTGVGSYVNMRAAHGTDQMGSLPEAQAGGTSLPQHHRHVRARLSVETSSETNSDTGSTSSSAGGNTTREHHNDQRDDRSSNTQAQSARRGNTEQGRELQVATYQSSA